MSEEVRQNIWVPYLMGVFLFLYIHSSYFTLFRIGDYKNVDMANNFLGF